MLLEGPSSSPTNPSSSSSIHATIYSSFSQAMLPSHHAYTDDDEGHKDKDEDSEGRTIKSNTEAGRKRKTDTDYSATTNHNNINTIVGPIITGGHRPQSTVPTSAFMKRILLHEACFHQHSRRCPNMIKFFNSTQEIQERLAHGPALCTQNTRGSVRMLHGVGNCTFSLTLPYTMLHGRKYHYTMLRHFLKLYWHIA